MNVREFFSSSYAQARAQFLAAAEAAQAPVQSYVHPLLGAEGEVLAVDVALDGASDAQRLLIVSSGVHGVEGFGGSGAQVAALGHAQLRAQARAAGVAVLYVHALNPYGFSHLRRVTHENVDLNRNFLDFSQVLPQNPAYRELHALLLPAHWPPSPDNQQQIAAYLQQHGARAFQQAVSTGQYEFADGLFFGGTQACWSNLALRRILQHYGASARHIGWIDLHSGLGPSGYGERCNTCRNDGADLARVRRWWDSGGSTPVRSLNDGSSVSASLQGVCWFAVYEECAQAQYTGMAVEFGTQSFEQVSLALRGEQWLHTHPQTSAQAATLRRALRDAFYVDTDDWKLQIVQQSLEAMQQGIVGLGEEG